MSDLDIILMYKKGYSIKKIAKRYKKMQKIVFKKNITLIQSQNIIEKVLLYYYNKNNIIIDLVKEA